MEEEAFNHREQCGDTSHKLKYKKIYFSNNNIFTKLSLQKLTEISITFHHTEIWCRVFFLLVWGAETGIKSAEKCQNFPTPEMWLS